MDGCWAWIAPYAGLRKLRIFVTVDKFGCCKGDELLQLCEILSRFAQHQNNGLQTFEYYERLEGSMSQASHFTLDAITGQIAKLPPNIKISVRIAYKYCSKIILCD